MVSSLQIIIGISLVVVITNGVVAASPQFSAMFVFGDSLTDAGNNNYLNSLAKANYVPYGVDFIEGPSGRFCNGRTITDFLGNYSFLASFIVFLYLHVSPNFCRYTFNYTTQILLFSDNTGDTITYDEYYYIVKCNIFIVKRVSIKIG